MMMTRCVLTLLIGLVVSIDAFANSNLPACPSSGQKNNCYGSHTFGPNSDRPGTKYIGEWKDGKRHGQGLSTVPDGSTYEGMFKDGLPNGKGTFAFPDGKKIVGQVKDGKLDGQATSNLPDGSTFTGEFKDNMPNGQGTLTYADGAKYVGDWKDGKRDGQGTYTSPDGRKYVGEWKDDKRDGQGTFTSPDGRKYVGDWKDDKRDGQGTYTYADGSEYVGEWKGGQRNGQGTHTNTDGGQYVAEWKNDHPNGQGTYTNTDGSQYVGEFKDGQLNNQGTYTYADGAKYAGEYKDNMANGQGTYTYADGSKYVGAWKDDKFHGEGKFAHANGSSYLGRWEDGKIVAQDTIRVAKVLIPVMKNAPKADRLAAATRIEQATIGIFSCPDLHKANEMLGSKVSVLNDIPISNVAPQLLKFLNELEPQQISAPLSFDEGMAVFMVCERIKFVTESGKHTAERGPVYKLEQNSLDLSVYDHFRKLTFTIDDQNFKSYAAFKQGKNILGFYADGVVFYRDHVCKWRSKLINPDKKTGSFDVSCPSGRSIAGQYKFDGKTGESFGFGVDTLERDISYHLGPVGSSNQEEIERHFDKLTKQ